MGAGKRTFVIPKGQWRLRDVVARLGTAPVGSDFLMDINKNGTTIFTNQADRLTILAGNNANSPLRTQPGVFQRGDRLSIDVDQIGSGTAGSDLDLTAYLEKA